MRMHCDLLVIEQTFEARMMLHVGKRYMAHLVDTFLWSAQWPHSPVYLFSMASRTCRVLSGPIAAANVAQPTVREIARARHSGPYL